jgi:hypothetical protein
VQLLASGSTRLRPAHDGAPMSQNVRVAVRVRPFNSREVERNASCCIAMDGNKTTITDPETGRVREFTFDFSYWSHDAADSHFADQDKVFDDLGTDCLQSAWEGYNCRSVSQSIARCSRAAAAAAAASLAVLSACAVLVTALPAPPPLFPR